MGSVLAGLKMLKGTVGFAVIAVIAASFLPLLIQCCAYHLVFSAGNIVASATGGTKSAKLLSGLSDCVSLYISMVVFFSLIVRFGAAARKQTQTKDCRCTDRCDFLPCFFFHSLLPLVLFLFNR